MLASCGGTGGTGDPKEPTEARPSPTSVRGPAGAEPIRFQSDGDVELVGRLWGEGTVGVVLAHGFSQGSGQDDWLPYAGELADEGYLVLTFNFRGFCDDRDNVDAQLDCSGIEIELDNNWLDVIAAVEFLESEGVAQVFLVGASMGGLAVLRAAADPRVEAAGVVSLSTPQFPSKYYGGESRENDVTPARLADLDEPLLFVAGTGDVQTSAPLKPEIDQVVFADDAQRMFDAAREPKDVLLVDSRFHSSELVTLAEDEVVEETRGAISEFLTKSAG
jgi:pimeloyl-ACP methyl ester carboxylesterase